MSEAYSVAYYQARLGPLVERTVAILRRRGLLPPEPPELVAARRQRILDQAVRNVAREIGPPVSVLRWWLADPDRCWVLGSFHIRAEFSRLWAETQTPAG